MVDLEGLEDVEDSVIEAILEGENNRADTQIHPDANSPSHGIPLSQAMLDERRKKAEHEEKARKEMEKKRNPDIYPLF